MELVSEPSMTSHETLTPILSPVDLDLSNLRIYRAAVEPRFLESIQAGRST